MAYKIRWELKGLTPILMHQDDVEAADDLSEWRKDQVNKNISKAGDDRSPPWSWMTYLYSDGQHVAMPTQNIMSCLKTAGTRKIMKKQKTYKEITQSGLVILSEYCDFFNNGKQVPIAKIEAFQNKEFKEHLKRAVDLGFELDVRRAPIGKSKHVRVRPKFAPGWEVKGEMEVFAPELTFDIMKEIFQIAGRVGLCDWRPGCRTPGTFGIFQSKLTKL